ncbi:MAG: NnrU family protein [Gammaproteobacteria bacterium]|nr:NnrU family protein [Gammaproteobacteria bacterium]
MNILILGLVVFIGIHLIPCMTSLKAGFVSKMGANGYKGMFSIVSFIGLGLIIYGMGKAEFIPVYDPPSWGRYFTMIIMIPALILLPAANMPTNITRFIRHPMLLGTALWAAGHLAANGDQASLILFGSLGVYAIFDIWSANSRGATNSTQVVPIKKDIIVVLAGLVAYTLLSYFHGTLFGMPVV